MCDSPELLAALARIEKILQPSPLKAAVYQTILVSDTQPWLIDYKGFKHLYIWLPQALSFNLGEWGTGPVQAQVWIDFAIKPGIPLKTSGQSTPVPIMLLFSDTEVP